MEWRMFKRVRPQFAIDEDRKLSWTSMSESSARFESKGRTLFLEWEFGRDDDGAPLTIICLPAELFWEAPYNQEPIGLMERHEIKAQIEEAAAVLDYQVEFVDSKHRV